MCQPFVTLIKGRPLLSEDNMRPGKELHVMIEKMLLAWAREFQFVALII